MLKKISLVVLAATFVTGSAVVANAEIHGDGAPPGPTSERGLRMDYAAKHGGDRAFSSGIPSYRGSAYGYAPQRRIVRPHKNGRNN